MPNLLIEGLIIQCLVSLYRNGKKGLNTSRGLFLLLYFYNVIFRYYMKVHLILVLFKMGLKMVV